MKFWTYTHADNGEQRTFPSADPRYQRAAKWAESVVEADEQPDNVPPKPKPAKKPAAKKAASKKKAD